MLLLPMQQVMYGKIEQRNLSRKVCMAGSIAAFCFLWLWGIGIMDWNGIYYTLLCAVAASISFGRFRKLKKAIMPVLDCFIRLEEESLEAYQPGDCGEYEYCHIFFSEIAQIVLGSRYRRASFYIVLKDNAVKSSIGMADTPGRRIFLVKGEVYDRKEFLTMYQNFCEKLPAGAEHGILEIPDGWRREPVDMYCIFLWLISAFFLLPVFYMIL